MPGTLQFCVKLLLAFLLGSVLGAMLVGRLRGGVDLRTQGSGNPGVTNALRTQGKLFGAAVLGIDFIKGALAAGLLPAVPLPWIGPAPAPALAQWMPAGCAAAAVLGHVFPPWHGFRGGKGIATAGGALAALSGLLFWPMLAVWLVVLAVCGIVSLASLAAALCLPVIVLVTGLQPQRPLLCLALGLAALVLFTHRSNLRRLRVRSEPRLRARKPGRHR